MLTQISLTPQTRRPQNEARRCSFCGKPEQQVEHMISSKNSVHICNECVALCGEIVAEHRAQDSGN
jgi:ATP-dependent Clp protease ATP-binding subunit ClpX